MPCQRLLTSSAVAKSGDGNPLKRLADLAQSLSEDEQVSDSAETSRSAWLPSFPPRIWSPDTESEESMLQGPNTQPPTQGAASRHRWTSDEKRRLLAVINQCRQSSTGPIVWPDVQERFKHRSLIACRDVYYRFLRQQATVVASDDHKSGRQKYSATEIQKLNELVRKYGEHSWTTVAREMEAATGISRHKGVYLSYWNSTLCPKAQSAPPWTAERTKRLQNLVSEHGPDPVFLAYKFFPEYTPYIIKDRMTRLRQASVGQEER
ncbi:hypothetical protein IWW37_003529 [Coemansia sp. RSA 2050]|nr:hypothetical protein IWW37_003529 [Coemansia sp. RSA 2050]KAJ2732939.1 hypothetical protein IW152_003433 [Coemansia sp. BCRC 34962]